MLGGSEDDLCRPVRSKGLGFQVLDAEPPGPDNWTGDEMGKKEMGVIKMKKREQGCLPEPASTNKVKSFPFQCN